MIASKDQEREALQQIREIVKGLGEDSYLSAAFEGCFEIAESNIDNDFACSMKQRAESAERRLEEANIEIADLEARLTAESADSQNMNTALEVKTTEAKNEHQRYLEECAARSACEKKIGNLEGELHWEKMRVMELKAKLYDFMVKENEEPGPCR